MCYRDVGRTLTGTNTASDSMTVESCISFCISDNFQYAGAEYARECCEFAMSKTVLGTADLHLDCSNTIAAAADAVPSAECNMECAGNSTETCGAGNRLSLYWSGVTVSPPSNAPTVGNYSYESCRTEGTAGRALTSRATASDTMTIETCAAFCSGFTYFGTEFGRECMCIGRQCDSVAADSTTKRLLRQLF
jgi:hypothetical protein